jgi:hypothetical protein
MRELYNRMLWRRNEMFLKKWVLVSVWASYGNNGRTMPSCVFCGKVITTHGGLKRHITSHPECRRQWVTMIEDNEAGNLDAQEAPVDFSHNDAGHVHAHPSADMDNNPAPNKSRRVTVEDVEDEDGSSSWHHLEPQLDAGWALRGGETKFERCRRYQEEEGEETWSPFEDA